MRLDRVLLAIAAVCAALAAPSSASAGIEYRTLFQDPGARPGPDLSLEQHAIRLIDATPAGQRITFAFRDFNRQPVADALIAADVRGVQVDGVIDGGERNRLVVKQLQAALGPDRFVICGSPAFVFNSCIADSETPSLQHNKFLTFSRLDDRREHVVLQTSMNFLEPTQLNYYNDMVEIAGDHALYDGYVDYVAALKAQVRSSDHYVIVSGDDGRNVGAVGLKRLHVEMSGAQAGSWDFPGESDGYRVEELSISEENETTVTWFAEDLNGNLEAPRSTVVRVDKTAPVISGVPRRCEIWPPNHRLVHVADISAADALSGPPSLLVAGTSGEPGDARDIVIRGGSVDLRAEKAAHGRARAYLLSAVAVDAAGNEATAVWTCVVGAPELQLPLAQRLGPA